MPCSTFTRLTQDHSKPSIMPALIALATPFRHVVGVLLVMLSLAACAPKDTTPVTLGFVAGVTGRTADLGAGGRNGVQLAVDETNAAGGIHGRRIDLLVKDSESNAELAKAKVSELLAANVQAIIGPMTSADAVAAAPLATAGNTLMMASTVTTTALSGIDDQFFRVIASTTAHTATMARYLVEKRQARKVNLLVNLGNKAYAQSWADDFSSAMKALGGPPPRRLDYFGNENVNFAALARELVKDKPDAIILITNAVDAAHIADQLVLAGSKAVHVTSEWAGTGKLIELGGVQVEGFIVPQYLDLTSTRPAYIAFREAYQKRYGQPPGFPAVLSYDAARVVLRALAEAQPGETLKQALLRIRHFDGLQGKIDFDNFGDVQSSTFLTEIRDGHYIPQH